jgi:phage terminase large subunit-like protein
MNPLHNMENIDPDYIDGVLRQLPFALRKRFLEGEFFSDDSDIFQPQWIRPGLTGDYDMIISTCDPAISEKKTADEAAICTIGITKAGKAEEIETIHGRWGFDGLISNLHAVEARHKPDYAGVESVAFQKSVAAVLRRDNPATRWRGLDEFGVRSDVDKVRRSISISYLLERGVATVNTPALSKQLLEFEGGDEKNDLVDAYVYALQLYQRVWHPKPVEQEHVIVSYDERVRRYLDNRRKSMAKAKQGEGKDPFLGSRW